jgi:hypothetical protein
VPPLQVLAGEAGGRWGLARRAGDGAAAQDVALHPGRHGVGIVYKAVLTGREAQVRAIARFRHPNVYLLEGRTMERHVLCSA